MWEEINKKQNEDDMIQLLFYSRCLYNNSTRIAILKIIVVIINRVILIFLRSRLMNMHNDITINT